MGRSNAFTLIELLVVVAIIALLITILLPTLDRVQEKTRQVVCMNNLSVIFKGWGMYKGANKGAPPILPDVDQITAHYDDDLRMHDECTAAALGAGAQQNLCLLMKVGCLSTWDVFLCPSTETAPANRSAPGRKYGLGEATYKSYCDYAIQIPYVGDSSEGYPYGDSLCPLTKHMNGGIAIIADRGDNPNPKGGHSYNLLTKWSRNHPNDGESVLYVDGHVRFSKDIFTSPAGVKIRNTGGWGENNIYTCEYWADRTTDNPWVTPLSYDHGYRSNVQPPDSTKDSVLYAWGN